ncbi:MAG TPA: hypothetical protein HA345_02675 [Candidatus Thalassarchaeaceae archaeon]|nr:MAG TPA: hypothetical protein D7H94_02660 [Candidatus Poseidoniales archaeon]HIH84293.1 hypothetical protein [Candidatus Thalassarchaeaceae archaeon]
MVDRADLLVTIQTGRLEELKEIAANHSISRTGSVERLRVRLIEQLILDEEELAWDGIQDMSNRHLTDVLKVFGIKSSGSHKDKRQRLWLHVHQDPKTLSIDTLPDMNRDDLHELCARLEMPRSGNKTQLVARVGGVLSSQEGAWGRIKRSVKRGAVAPAKVPAPQKEAPIPVENTPIQENTMDVPAIEEDTPEEETVVEAPLDEVVPDEATEDHVADTRPLSSTIEAGAEIALNDLQSREAEVRSLIRDFLLLGDQTPEDITAFIEDLKPRGFAVQHSIVRDAILDLVAEMAERRAAEQEAQSLLPGSWRERQAIRRFEELRNSLLDVLEETLLSARGDIPAARMGFENHARESGLDLDLPAISGRIHALFDLQISLNEMEMNVDPVAARRDRAIRLLLRRVDEIDATARATLERMEMQIESLERIVETVIRRNDGQFTSLEHSLMIRFLERRGWDANHPEVRPRLIAAAGALAVEMGYISEDQMPTLPGQIALDPERVTNVVETLNEVLESFGRKPARTVEELDNNEEEDVDEAEVARRTLDAADAVLDRLRKMTEEGA